MFQNLTIYNVLRGQKTSYIGGYCPDQDSLQIFRLEGPFTFAYPFKNYHNRVTKFYKYVENKNKEDKQEMSDIFKEIKENKKLEKILDGSWYYDVKRDLSLNQFNSYLESMNHFLDSIRQPDKSTI